SGAADCGLAADLAATIASPAATDLADRHAHQDQIGEDEIMRPGTMAASCEYADTCAARLSCGAQGAAACSENAKKILIGIAVTLHFPWLQTDGAKPGSR